MPLKKHMVSFRIQQFFSCEFNLFLVFNYAPPLGGCKEVKARDFYMFCMCLEYADSQSIVTSLEKKENLAVASSEPVQHSYSMVLYRT